MDPLHRRDHAELREAWDVGRRDVLCVLDAPPTIRLARIRAERALVDVEHLPVRAVADRVRRELEVVAHRDVRDLLEARRLLERKSRAARQVGVRREQPGAIGAERAVDLALDGAHREETIRAADHAIAVEQAVHPRLRLEAHHDVEPQRELALVGDAPEQIDRRERASRIVERGDPLGQRVGAGERHGLARVGLALRGRT